MTDRRRALSALAGDEQTPKWQVNLLTAGLKVVR